jgi:hypothetical protein
MLDRIGHIDFTPVNFAYSRRWSSSLPTGPKGAGLFVFMVAGCSPIIGMLSQFRKPCELEGRE